MIMRADIGKDHMKRLKVALIIGFIFIAIAQLISMMTFLIPLDWCFACGPHDGFILDFTNHIAYAIGPTNDVLTKPLAGLVAQNEWLHESYMINRGMYAAYVFCLGVLFSVLAAIIVSKIMKSRNLLGNDAAKQKKLRRTVLSICFVAIPITLCFAVIFVMVLVENTTHR